MKGDKEERDRGTVYVRWGHDQCPSTAQLVYSGRGGGSHFDHMHTGGGSNPQCLPLDPNFLTPIIIVEHSTELTCMELNIVHTLTVIITFMDVIMLMYHVQFVMSVIVLQSTWFPLSTHALQDGSESIMAI